MFAKLLFRLKSQKQTVTKIISNLSRIVMRRDNADFIFQHKEKTFLDNVMTFLCDFKKSVIPIFGKCEF